MRRLALVPLLLLAAPVFAQQDPAYGILTQAYAALDAGNYDAAISYFLQALPIDRDREDIREDLGYTYIKDGQDQAAMGPFQQVMDMAPANYQAALQYAFLAYEQQDNSDIAQARNIFLLVSQQTADPVSQATAETAFENVDGTLAANIAYYQLAVLLDPMDYTDHQLLADYAEQRSELTLAAQEFKIALDTGFASLYLDYARVLGKLGDVADQIQALESVVNSADPYTAEQARQQLAAMGQLPASGQ
jgi:tetratricopeptide (TPR) repeat protein